MRRQLLLMLLAFAGGSAIAAMAGAVNAGVALSVGAICFAAAVVALTLSE